MESAHFPSHLISRPLLSCFSFPPHLICARCCVLVDCNTDRACTCSFVTVLRFEHFESYRACFQTLPYALVSFFRSCSCLSLRAVLLFVYQSPPPHHPSSRVNANPELEQTGHTLFWRYSLQFSVTRLACCFLGLWIQVRRQVEVFSVKTTVIGARGGHRDNLATTRRGEVSSDTISACDFDY